MSAPRAWIKNGLRRLGYTLQRLPPPISDPQFALQVGFDYVLDHYFASRTDPRPFFFLQVGAFEGFSDADELYQRVREGGWHGILVEPQPSHYRRLVENYAGLDGLTFVNAAIAESAEPRTMYVIQDETGEPIESLGGLSSFDEEHLRALHGKLSRHPGSRVGSIEVACTTFTEMLGDVSYIDLLHIDAEGYDAALLMLFDFDRLMPPIVRFEHRHLSPDELDEAVLLLAHHGYRIVREEYDVTAYAALKPA